MKTILFFSFFALTTLCYSQSEHISLKQIYDTLKPGWNYSQDTDGMTSAVCYMARLKYDGKVYKPYSLKSKVMLMIENYGGTDIFSIILPNGSFIKNSHDSVNVLLRFDEGKIEHHTFTLAKQTNKNEGAIYRDEAYADNLIEQLKKAKKLRVQFDLPDNDAEVAGFDIAHFKWEHKNKEAGKK